MTTEEPSSEPGGAWRVKKSKFDQLAPGDQFELDFTPTGLRVFGNAGRVAMTVQYKDVVWENWGGSSAMIQLSGDQVEVERAGQQTPMDVQLLLIKWRRDPKVDPLDDPATRPAVLVWSYPGRTQADAAVLFSAHAQELSRKGYRPTSQSWGEGRPGWARVLLISELAESIRPNGFLTVTYELVTPGGAPATPKGPDVIDQIRRLGELRDAGIVTEDEFATKKAELLARL
jgi:hypothetical protein